MKISLSALVFFGIMNLSQIKPVVIEVEVHNNRVSVLFDRDIDTAISICSAVEIYPSLIGHWTWYSNRKLDFFSESCISDTAVYLANVTTELKDTDGNSVGPTGFVFTGLRSISYITHRSPLQWEDVSNWDVEADWRYGPRIQTIKPKLHSSSRSIVGVLFCWEHLYYGSLRQDHGLFRYPNFITSEAGKYKVAVDSSGVLYLVDMILGRQYRRLVSPENLSYQAMDVSDRGEVIIALSANRVVATSLVYLFDFEGAIVWAQEFPVHDYHEMIVDMCFINTADMFLIHTGGKIYCFKINRVD